MIFCYRIEDSKYIEIGKPIKCLRRFHGLEGDLHEPQPFIAVRHATYDEFLKYIIDQGVPILPTTLEKAGDPNWRYVEVVTD